MSRSTIAWEPLVEVESVPLANRLLQCAVLVSMSPGTLHLIVGSRDQTNRGRILSLKLSRSVRGQWSVAHSSELMSADDVPGVCLGVVPGDLVMIRGRRQLFGNAYFNYGGRFCARLFSVPLNEDAESLGSVISMHSAMNGFRVMPAVTSGPDGLHLIFSEGRPSRAGGYPGEYSLRVVPFRPPLASCAHSYPMCVPARSRLAVARFTQDPVLNTRGWFSHRHSEGGGYQLGRCILNEDGRAADVWWSDNGGLGETPQELGMLSYPEALSDSQLIASAGRFGDRGLVLLSTRGLDW